MQCEEARPQLLDLLYEELPAEEEATLVRRHCETCAACAQELRALEATLGAIDAWGHVPVGEPFRPAPALQALRSAQARQPRWFRAVGRGGPWEVCLSALCGVAFAALTMFLLRDYVAAAALSAPTHVILGVLSGGLCAGLVHLALRGGQAPGGLRLQPTAWAVLIAIFLTCLLLGLVPLPTLLARPVVARFLGVTASGAGSTLGYLVLGGAVAAVPFLIGGLAAGRRIRERLLPHAVAAACVYVVVIAPGLAIVCAPLGLAVYMSMLGGGAIGGLGGVLAGLWLITRT